MIDGRVWLFAVQEVLTINLESILTAVGGVGLFLYGMMKMGEGLQRSAGDRMRRILETLTANRLMAVVVGAVVTAIIQASGATTVMVVGFVNAGLMTLEQAIGVIMGSNIGTTVTAQLVAFDLEKAALPAVALGMVLKLGGKRRRIKGLSDCVIGFGLLFLGISVLGGALAGLRDYAPFVNMIVESQRNPILGVVVGMLFTVALQSSSATTGLLVAMAARGIMPLGAAVPMVFGANIGTTSTALLASVGTTLAAKRAAMAHFFFNFFGTLVSLPFLRLFERLAEASSTDVARQVANAHTLFNVIVTVLLIPFLGQFAKFVTSVVKGEDNTVVHGPQYLNLRLIPAPFTAVIQLRKEVVRMARLCQENFNASISAFLGDSGPERARFDGIEDVIDGLEQDISVYVSAISQRGVNREQARMLTSMINIATDLERIGDHATGIFELVDYKEEHRLVFSNEALLEIRDLAGRVSEILTKTIECLEKDDKVMAASIGSMDDVVDAREKELRGLHIKRLNQGTCYPAAGVIYLDLLTHMERIGDHAVNVAEAILGTTEVSQS